MGEAVKERPILFSGEMVRAILAGAKTQTRRVVKGDVEEVDRPRWYARRLLVHSPRCQRQQCEQVDDWTTACGGYDCEPGGRVERSPYGQPGDRLWVRESVALDYFSSTPWLEPTQRHGYRADWSARAADTVPEPRWTPSIHMPRWASRITLEITKGRVQRLQEISDQDARREGLETSEEPFTYGWRNYGQQEFAGEMETYFAEPIDSFRSLWDSINGKRGLGWKSNPWVWVLTFRRVER